MKLSFCPMHKKSLEELIPILQDHIFVKYGSTASISDLITSLKDLDFNVLQFFNEAKALFKELENSKYTENVKHTKKIAKIIMWFELGAILLSEGATIDEVQTQLGAPVSVIKILIKEKLKLIPESTLQFFLLLERQRKLAGDLINFFRANVGKLSIDESLLSEYLGNQVKLNPFDYFTLMRKAKDE